MLAKAREFLAAALQEVDGSPTVAYANAYTAGRQAVTALMMSEGLRVADKSSEHATVIDYGRAAIPASRDLDLALLERMRRHRHEIEYEPRHDATPQQARQACAFVARLVDVVGKRLRPIEPPS